MASSVATSISRPSNSSSEPTETIAASNRPVRRLSISASELSVLRVISTFGMFGVEVGEQSGDVHAVRRHRADRDGAPDQLGEVVDRNAGLRDGGQRGPGVRQHRLARGGQPHRAVRPSSSG